MTVAKIGVPKEYNGNWELIGYGAGKGFAKATISRKVDPRAAQSGAERQGGRR